MQTTGPKLEQHDEQAVPLEGLTYSFIVKIWVEEALNQPGRFVWRGHITHVPSAKRAYFQSLSAIPLFIVPFLAQMGARLNPYWRLRMLLHRLKEKQTDE